MDFVGWGFMVGQVQEACWLEMSHVTNILLLCVVLCFPVCIIIIIKNIIY